MRDQGGGMLLSPSSIERKKASLKLSGREAGNERVRKRPVYGSEGSCREATKLTGNLLSFAAGKLKGGSLISSSNGGRHHIEELHVERLLPMSRASSDEGLNLPQWGRGKRSRCTRLEPAPSNKHTPTSSVPASFKLHPRPLKKPLPSAAHSSKLWSHSSSSKPSSSKFTGSDAPVLRNGVINKSTHRSGHVNGLDSVRQVEEAKERAASSQQRCNGSDVGTTSHGQVGTSSLGHVGTTNHGHGLRTGNATTSNHAIVTSSISLAKVEWPRFTMTLTRREKEEDFLVFKGAKLPQRPKKRLKVVEKAILFCTPGNWLGDLSQGRYDVREKKSLKKKPSGLKAMDSAESDSE